jgi:signal transduction histidine kinase
MIVFGRYRWFVVAAGITSAFVGVSLLAPRSSGLTSFADVFGFAIGLIAVIAALANVVARPSTERWFWALMAFGLCLWDFNQAAWAYREALLHLSMPDPYFSDIVLFFHLVPMIAAVVWRPDLLRKESPFHLSTLHFLMLLVWWVFLYAFIVFPHQYVIVNASAYDKYYVSLYQVENMLLVLVLGFAAWTSSAGWKRLYLNFMGAEALYAVGSQLLDKAMAKGSYYSGSVYDIPMAAAMLWIGATVLSARHWELNTYAPDAKWKWGSVTPRLAMLAILSLPLLGLWTFILDPSPPASRMFRLFTVLAAMLVLGVFVFLRQYIQDQALMHLLQESRNSFENQQRLQNHLVQKEKLASLGQLVAGASHEIDDPLTAIMTYSEQLWSSDRLSADQGAMVRKIVNQARRTRDLVSNLLSFARQVPGEKTPVDLAVLLHRSAQMLESRHPSSRIRVEILADPELPRVRGNANQLFQIFVEIIENAMDALEEVGGGSLQINAQKQGQEAVLQFSDTGPGLHEPERVFDPFYTTKPIGKGTGLGLSAVYGVVQDHGGQITCQNKPGGGALFVVRFPAVTELVVHAAEAAKA